MNADEREALLRLVDSLQSLDTVEWERARAEGLFSEKDAASLHRAAPSLIALGERLLVAMRPKLSVVPKVAPDVGQDQSTGDDDRPTGPRGVA